MQHLPIGFTADGTPECRSRLFTRCQFMGRVLVDPVMHQTAVDAASPTLVDGACVVTVSDASRYACPVGDSQYDPTVARYMTVDHMKTIGFEDASQASAVLKDGAVIWAAVDPTASFENEFVIMSGRIGVDEKAHRQTVLLRVAQHIGQPGFRTAAPRTTDDM